MTTRAYRDRVARSKAHLAERLEELASENAGMEPDAFVALARERHNCPITEDYARELLDGAAASRAPPRP